MFVNYTSAFCLLILTVFGFNTRNLLQSQIKEIALEGKSIHVINTFLPHDPFPYGATYSSMSYLDKSKCLSVGVTYGVFSEILTGYDLRQIVNLERISGEFISAQGVIGEGFASVSSESLELASVSCIVLGNVTNAGSTISTLLQNGWILKGIEIDNRFGTAVFILKSRILK